MHSIPYYDSKSSYDAALWTSISTSMPICLMFLIDIWNYCTRTSPNLIDHHRSSLFFYERIYKFSPLITILIPNVALLIADSGYASSTDPNTRFAIIVFQMIFSTGACISADLSLELIPKILKYIINIFAFALFWISKSQSLHSSRTNVVLAVVGVSLHFVSAFMNGATFRWMFEYPKRESSFHDAVDSLKGLCFTGHCVLYAVLVAANWLIHFTGSSSHGWAHLGELELYLYALSVVPIVVTVIYSGNIRDKLSVAKMATKMNMNLARFISHELRSHVSHLTLGLQLLGDDVGDSKKSAITDLQQSCDSVMQVLNDLVVFEKLANRAGPNEEKLKSLIDIDESVRSVAADLEAKKVRYTRDT